MLRGKTQYPSTQTDWKKEIFPPSSFAFNVTTNAPHQIMTNTAANTSEVWSAGAFKLSTTDSMRQSSSGPQRSPAAVDEEVHMEGCDGAEAVGSGERVARRRAWRAEGKECE